MRIVRCPAGARAQEKASAASTGTGGARRVEGATRRTALSNAPVGVCQRSPFGGAALGGGPGLLSNCESLASHAPRASRQGASWPSTALSSRRVAPSRAATKSTLRAAACVSHGTSVSASASVT